MARAEGQLAPRDGDLRRFRADQAELLERLGAAGLEVRRYDSAFNPYPFRVPRARLAELLAVQESVGRALVALVKGYARDARIRDVIALSDEERALVTKLEPLPYRPGAYRPDFLHAADGRALITEINARFPLNGFLSSALLDRIMAQTRSRRRLPGLAALEERIARRLGSGPIGIVKSTEPGWDIHLVRGEAVRAADLTPEHLARWESVVLELHQHELMHEVPERVLFALAAHGGALNDLRTILVAHDKRLLALLSTSDVLLDYVERADVERLRRHVVPTWVKGISPDKVREAMERTDGWIAKPPRGGKGKGIVVSRLLEPLRWRETLAGLPDDWVLQPYIEQTPFPITTVRDGALVTAPMHVVGLLPSLDDHAFGPGMYRASADALVNVARGGTILAPVLDEAEGDTDV